METTARAQHTPGPWEAYNGHDRKLGSWAILGPEPVANRASQVICRTSDDGLIDAANACLIASAPALLAALEALLNEHRLCVPLGSAAAREADAAIRQAHGND